MGCIALTPNEEVNLLWVNKIRSETRAPRVFVTLRPGPRSVPPQIVHEAGAVVLFGRSQMVEDWSERLSRDEATVERWRFAKPLPEDILESLKERIRGATGKDVLLDTSEDPKILGGAVIRVGDRLVDGSLRTRLRQLRKQLRSSGFVWAQYQE